MTRANFGSNCEPLVFPVKEDPATPILSSAVMKDRCMFWVYNNINVFVAPRVFNSTKDPVISVPAGHGKLTPASAFQTLESPDKKCQTRLTINLGIGVPVFLMLLGLTAFLRLRRKKGWNTGGWWRLEDSWMGGPGGASRSTNSL